MKITKRQLRRIIKEERARIIREEADQYAAAVGDTFAADRRKFYDTEQGNPGQALSALHSAIDSLIKAMGSEEARLELQGIVEDWE